MAGEDKFRQIIRVPGEGLLEVQQGSEPEGTEFGVRAAIEVWKMRDNIAGKALAAPVVLYGAVPGTSDKCRLTRGSAFIVAEGSGVAPVLNEVGDWMDENHEPPVPIGKITKMTLTYEIWVYARDNDGVFDVEQVSIVTPGQDPGGRP